MKLEGTFMKAGVRNSNGRIYPLKEMQAAFEEYQKKVERGEAYCRIMDISHPEKMFDDSLIEDNCGQVTDVWMNDGTVYGKITLFDTPNGNVVRDIVNTMGSVNVAPSMLVETNVRKNDDTANESEEDSSNDFPCCDSIYDAFTKYNDIDVDSYNVVEIRSFDICRESAWPDAKVKPIEEDKE